MLKALLTLMLAIIRRYLPTSILCYFSKMMESYLARTIACFLAE